ncbi:MAG: Carboxypeptidase [Caulobacter sp.]|nr:Carboxypeptidase [Caulobacter sp.]
MRILDIAKLAGAALAALMLVAAPLASAAPDAKDKDVPKVDVPKPDKAIGDLPPFPADKSVKQTMVLGGKMLSYTATVGSLPVRDDKGKKIGEVVYTAYHLDGGAPGRPVTFAFNGGPGAASVYLNLGAIGPKRVQFGAQGDFPSDQTGLVDNPGTWLDFTDLVFIDPIGTGYSRSLISGEDEKKAFFTLDGDISYLSRIVFDWLVKNDRMASAKYVVGESYGGYRAPRIAHFLQTDLGVGPSGVVMVSPFLDAQSEQGGNFGPMAWVSTLPSMAAANLERHGQPLNAETMAPIEAYARGEYVTDLLKGRSDQAALDRMVTHVSALTGLDPAFVRRSGARIDSNAFLRELYRDQGKVGSWYDSNVTAFDPFPWSSDGQGGDPILNGIIAPTTTAMVDFVTHTVGWKVEARYNALSGDVGAKWEKGWWQTAEAVTDFRQAVAVDPKMKVLIVHGYDDLSCPYMVSKIVVDQMPLMGDPGRVQVKVYPGGHMFYSRPASQAALRHDVMVMYGVAS